MERNQLTEFSWRLKDLTPTRDCVSVSMKGRRMMSGRSADAWKRPSVMKPGWKGIIIGIAQVDPEKLTIGIGNIPRIDKIHMAEENQDDGDDPKPVQLWYTAVINLQSYLLRYRFRDSKSVGIITFSGSYDKREGEAGILDSGERIC